MAPVLIQRERPAAAAAGAPPGRRILLGYSQRVL
jgi:hypothetical protein